MNRIEVNAQTGKSELIQLTAEEVADAQTRTKAEDAKRAARAAEETLRYRLHAAIDALLIEQAKRADAPQAVKDYAEAVK